jgi:hypothetical protein
VAGDRGGAHFTFFGSLPSVARDLEPEYITVSADSRTVWVTLQEANCIAVVDLAAAPRKVSQLGPNSTAPVLVARVPGSLRSHSPRDGRESCSALQSPMQLA